MRAQGTPSLVMGKTSRALVREQLGQHGRNEAWLQRLIFDHPQMLPVAEIEPGFGALVAAAMEVPCGHGYIDNIYLTPAGEIILVETKLWTNPQARREVVAQALDYAAALARMDFVEFECSVLAGILPPAKPASLHQMVAGHPDALDEAAFNDAVALNLRRGRMLVIAAGDGIRRETEALGDLLQSHAGAHFTFALVELACWRVGEGEELLVIPSTLMRTVMIERGIVRIEHGSPVIAAPRDQPAAQTLTDKLFDEAMAARRPDLPQAIRAFIASLEPLGVYTELKASLNLKLEPGDAHKPINLGYIQKNGQLWTNGVANAVPPDIARAYLERLAGIIGGSVAAAAEPYVSANGKSAPRIEQFLPAHAAEWREAIEALVRQLNQRRPA